MDFEKDIKTMSKVSVENIVVKYLGNRNVHLENYYITSASDKMLGFLCDYWKLVANIVVEDKKEVVSFFIKAVSNENPAKAEMVHEFNLFQKELLLYSDIKKSINIKGLKYWSPSLIAFNDEAMIFEDLNYLGYRNRSKLLRFDIVHTLQALETLATFHSLSIISEENKRKNNPLYNLAQDYENRLDEGGYTKKSVWFMQCMTGSLESVKEYSKYRHQNGVMDNIEERWKDAWVSALNLCRQSEEHRSVICHRDLWNNNIMFHYNDDEVPDGCVFVDYQGIRLQPPAGDIMLLLYSNLDRKIREDNFEMFLSYYYETLDKILNDNNISISYVLPRDKFFSSAEEQRKWGLIASSCLLPQLLTGDEITTKLFMDTNKFDEIMSRTKGEFIKQMMKEDSNYLRKVIELFDEVIERYVLV